ncbi:MAG TPA: hypothetical protein VGN52_10510 [Burkholderiales bacterium]|jgi:hypothetical protein
MPKLDAIHAKLLEASRLLDEAAREMRELNGEGGRLARGQVSKIGAAMAEVMLVRHQIYVLRPDLMPGYLQDAQDRGVNGNDRANDSDSGRTK